MSTCGATFNTSASDDDLGAGQCGKAAEDVAGGGALEDVGVKAEAMSSLAL